MNHSTAISILSIRRVIMLCLLIIPLSANAAIFMYIEGVPGDSQDADHRDWIDVLSVQESMTLTVDLSSGGRTIGRAKLLDTAINKALDRSSPLLRQELTSGRAIGEVIISVTKATEGGRAEYFRLRYTDVLLTSVSMQGSADDATILAEDVSFTFSRVEWTYTPFDERGIPGSPITTGWDVLLNQKI